MRVGAHLPGKGTTVETTRGGMSASLNADPPPPNHSSHPSAGSESSKVHCIGTCSPVLKGPRMGSNVNDETCGKRESRRNSPKLLSSVLM